MVYSLVYPRGGELMARPLDCKWAKFRGRWAIVGPASQMKPGAVVKVWNKTRGDYTDVRIRSVMGTGGSGQVMGFPQTLDHSS